MLKKINSEHMLFYKFMSTSCEIALRWMLQNIFDDKWTLVQIMAWCCQATSHYLIQYWPKSMLPYVHNGLNAKQQRKHQAPRYWPCVEWFHLMGGFTTHWVSNVEKPFKRCTLHVIFCWHDKLYIACLTTRKRTAFDHDLLWSLAANGNTNSINQWRPEQNGWHFTDCMFFKYTFLD